MGQKQTSRQFRVMSVIPLKADIHQRGLAGPLSAINGRTVRTLNSVHSDATLADNDEGGPKGRIGIPFVRGVINHCDHGASKRF